MAEIFFPDLFLGIARFGEGQQGSQSDCQEIEACLLQGEHMPPQLQQYLDNRKNAFSFLQPQRNLHNICQFQRIMTRYCQMNGPLPDIESFCYVFPCDFARKSNEVFLLLLLLLLMKLFFFFLFLQMLLLLLLLLPLLLLFSFLLLLLLLSFLPLQLKFLNSKVRLSHHSDRHLWDWRHDSAGHERSALLPPRSQEARVDRSRARHPRR